MHLGRCCAAVMMLAAMDANAANWYISPTGSDSAAGSLGAPFSTLNKAQSSASPGDTIYVRGGTYNYSAQMKLTKTGGSAASPFKVYAYPGDAAPVFDFTGYTGTSAAVSVETNYWHVKGITIQHGPDNGLHVRGSYNTIEQVVARQNGDSGIQIHSPGGAYTPSYNLILNCDSYENYDSGNYGENADGFAIKFRGLGPGNVLRGTRAWGNSDDGYDFWEAESGVTVENCWSFKNGYNLWGTSTFNGDSNGMKLGKDSGTHIVRNSMIWGHRANGIDVNGNALDITQPADPIAHGVQIYNNTAYDNDGRNFYFDESYAHILRNNASLLGGGSDNIYSSVIHDHNTWNGTAFATSSADFLSLDDAGAMGPRHADGSLPELGFLRLKNDSNLINSGVNVGTWSYGGAADLGAFEWITPGDVNTDGKVNTIDFNVLTANFGVSSGAMWRNGSFDFDGDVDSIDFSALLARYGTNVPAGSTALGAVVPEPFGGAMLLVSVAGMASVRRFRK